MLKAMNKVAKKPIAQMGCSGSDVCVFCDHFDVCTHCDQEWCVMPDGY